MTRLGEILDFGQLFITSGNNWRFSSGHTGRYPPSCRNTTIQLLQGNNLLVEQSAVAQLIKEKHFILISQIAKLKS